MTNHTIYASWGETVSFSCADSDLADTLEEAVYVMWEMEPAARLRHSELAHRLEAGIPTKFTYHGLQSAELTRSGPNFFLTEI